MHPTCAPGLPGAPDPAATPGRKEFVFLIEQALGHVVHSTNIARVLARDPEISGAVIPVRPGSTADVRSLPLIRNWSVQTSWAARDILRRRLDEGPVDAIFIHTQVASLFSCAVMRRVPTVISLDATPLNFDTMAEAYRHARQDPRIEKAKTLVNRRALLAADAIVTWSRWAADSVADDYGIARDRIHVVPPGVDLSRFQPAAGDRVPGPIRILFVGGDFERKGGGDLVEAMRRLDGAASLDVVSGTAIVPSGLPVRVHAGVEANSATITRLYREADIFVLPTHGDCTPLAISEALASGLPIVSTSVGALPELVVDGHNGIRVPAGDPRSLAEALAFLVERPDLRRVMGERSREMAEAEHDVDRNCRVIFDLMHAISRRRPRRAETGASSPRIRSGL